MSQTENWWEKAYYSDFPDKPNYKILHQCYWCGGCVLPDNTTVYPPNFDISKFEEGEQTRGEVEKYIPEELKKQNTSHVCCDKCKPYFLERRDRGL